MITEALYQVQIAREEVAERAEAVDAARIDLARAMAAALNDHQRDQVAEAAGMTPAGMYKALARVYGQRRPTPRRNPRPAGIDI